MELTNALSGFTIGTKAHKILRKVAVGLDRESQKFSGHPYIGRIARSSLRQHSLLVITTQCSLSAKRGLVIACRPSVRT